MLESFRALYGKNVTPQWHYGNGPDRPPTSCHMSIEGFRQGDAPATVYFNILVAEYTGAYWRYWMVGGYCLQLRTV